MKMDNIAKLPIKATTDSAGYDLYSAEAKVIEPGNRSFISTKIKIQMPKQCFGQLLSRSSLAKQGVDVAAGLIDSDYTGEIKVLLVNNSNEMFPILPGDRIAQLVVMTKQNTTAYIAPFDSFSTIRGNHGFGSSGK